MTEIEQFNTNKKQKKTKEQQIRSCSFVFVLCRELNDGLYVCEDGQVHLSKQPWSVVYHG